jgi:hypothetical protein
MMLETGLCITYQRLCEAGLTACNLGVEGLDWTARLVRLNVYGRRGWAATSARDTKHCRPAVPNQVLHLGTPTTLSRTHLHRTSQPKAFLALQPRANSANRSKNGGRMAFWPFFFFFFFFFFRRQNKWGKFGPQDQSVRGQIPSGNRLSSNLRGPGKSARHQKTYERMGARGRPRLSFPGYPQSPRMPVVSDRIYGGSGTVHVSRRGRTRGGWFTAGRHPPRRTMIDAGLADSQAGASGTNPSRNLRGADRLPSQRTGAMYRRKMFPRRAASA